MTSRTFNSRRPNNTPRLEETAGFAFKTISGRRLEMHPLPANGARHHLHRTTGIVAPAADLDPGKAGVAVGKQLGMPAEQALPRHRRTAGEN